MCDIRLSKRTETRNTINDYKISNLITLINSLVFIKRK